MGRKSCFTIKLTSSLCSFPIEPLGIISTGRDRSLLIQGHWATDPVYFWEDVPFPGLVFRGPSQMTMSSLKGLQETYLSSVCAGVLVCYSSMSSISSSITFWEERTEKDLLHDLESRSKISLSDLYRVCILDEILSGSFILIPIRSLIEPYLRLPFSET